MSQRSRGDDSTIAANLPAGAGATANAGSGKAALVRRALPGAYFFAAVVAISSASVGLPARAQESKLDALRGAAKASSADPNAALALGEALRIAGHYSESFAEFRRGIALANGRTPLLVELQTAVARAYADRHDLPRAMAACKELEHAKAPEPDVRACNAVADLGWQRATEAIEETTAALAKDPNHFTARLTQGRAFEMAIRPGDAAASLRAAIALRADGVEPHVVLGRVLVKTPATRADGLAELQKATQLGPSDPDALYELAVATGGTDPRSADRVRALGLLTQASRERPGFTGAWLTLGTWQLAAGNTPAAKDAADAALRAEPGNVGALLLAGKIALAGNDPDLALKDAQAALKILKNSAPAVLLTADSYAKKGEIDLALEAYQEAWGLDHGTPDPLIHAAEACHAAGRDTSARAYGAKAAQEFPNYAPAWVALGDALAAQKEAKDARDAYRKALGATDGAIDRASVQARLAALP